LIAVSLEKKETLLTGPADGSGDEKPFMGFVVNRPEVCQSALIKG